ncbi:DUF2484 family protein [Yoonia sp. 2307UL14-13]|uniref:DUF2484 family protein n=1 Tax=Yoonia sp. 2307UL14-13 TaxID=3126506 RepID=UPI00309A3AE0
MSIPAILGILWVFAATLTALLPMRYQYAPGITLLITAPILLIWIGIAHGWVLAVMGFAAFASMFRNPLVYFYRRAKGQRPEIPK